MGDLFILICPFKIRFSPNYVFTSHKTLCIAIMTTSELVIFEYIITFL